MSTKLFKNTEGKVLMSVGNKLIKQPYEFGAAHDIRETRGLSIANMYIRCKSPIQNISNGAFAIMTFMDTAINQPNNNSGVCRFESTSYIAALGLSFRTTDRPLITYNKTSESTYSTSTVQFASSSPALSMASTRTATFNLSKTKCNVFKNTTIGTEIDHSLISFTPETYNYFTFARGTAGYNSYENGINIAKWNRVLIFDRYVSQGEHLYFHNNGLGNDTQSYQGVILDIRCKFAEILDFSLLQDGSDMRVGCRDYSGFNRHGEIMNLPAGTLQQKTDYANANLFVPFQ